MASTAQAVWLGMYDFKRSYGRFPVLPPGFFNPGSWPTTPSITPSAPWHRFQRISDWSLDLGTGRIAGSSCTFDVLITAVDRMSGDVSEVVRSERPYVHATSGNFLWRIGFRHQVVKADHWRLLKFIREQKRNLYAGLRAFDPTQVVVGDQGFSGPNRPEKYLELFSGNHLKDALVFWDSAVPRYPANPYDAMPATLEAITLANVGHTNSPTVINNIIDIDRDAWAAGFRKGMVCSIGAFDVEDPGTELFKIADITNTGGTGRRIIVQTHPIGGGVSTGLSRPTVSGVTYPFGVHVRGFLGLIRGLSFDGLTVNVVEDAGFGSAAAITYNFKTAQDPLYIDLDQAIPPPGDGTIPSGGTDAYLNQQWP